MLPFQSSHCSQCDSWEKQPSHTKRDTEHEQVWSAFLFVLLEITWQEILLPFWSKEILNLILFSCPHISTKQDRCREDSSPKIQGESDESFLLLLWGSGLPAAADCVELYSSQRWQEQLWLQSRCQLRDDLLWVICHRLSQLCFCATSSNKWEALHHSEHRPPAEQHHLSVSSRCCDPLCAQQGLRGNSWVTSLSHRWFAVTKQFSGRRTQSSHDGLGQGKGYFLPELRQQWITGPVDQTLEVSLGFSMVSTLQFGNTQC